jgi:hypothetical protein
MRSGKMYPDPLHYDHLWPSMQRFARFLALRYDSLRTRHSYYRQLRLLCEHFGCADPALLTEDQLRAYLLHVKTVRLWKPKTMHQALATAHAFFSEMLDLGRWRVFTGLRWFGSGMARRSWDNNIDHPRWGRKPEFNEGRCPPLKEPTCSASF